MQSLLRANTEQENTAEQQINDRMWGIDETKTMAEIKKKKKMKQPKQKHMTTTKNTEL